MVSNVVMTQFTSSAVVVFLMQKLKSAAWFPLIQEGKVLINRTISILSAAAVTIGIGYTWDPTLDASGNRHMTFAIPTLAAIAVGLWHWLNQYALNEMVYRATAKPNGNGGATPAVAAVKP